MSFREALLALSGMLLLLLTCFDIGSSHRKAAPPQVAQVNIEASVGLSSIIPSMGAHPRSAAVAPANRLLK